MSERPLIQVCADDADSVASQVFGVSVHEIRSNRRIRQAVSDAKHTAWMLLRMNGRTLESIAKAYNTHHTTVRAGVARITKLCSVDASILYKITECRLAFGFPTKPVKPPQHRDPEPRHVKKPKLTNPRRLCDCSRVGKIKRGGSWMCSRCSMIDGRRWAEEGHVDPDAKYNRVFTYHLPHGNTLN